MWCLAGSPPGATNSYQVGVNHGGKGGTSYQKVKNQNYAGFTRKTLFSGDWFRRLREQVWIWERGQPSCSQWRTPWKRMIFPEKDVEDETPWFSLILQFWNIYWFSKAFQKKMSKSQSMKDVKRSLDLDSLVNLKTRQMYTPLNKVTLKLFLCLLFTLIVLVCICNSRGVYFCFTCLKPKYSCSL